MQYPLHERIGEPELLVGREKEFKLLDKWISGIPRRISKSRAILGRRKSGKTSIVQRIFNRLWSENREVIPFYYNFPEQKIWYPNLAVEYYRTFASHYISFLERDEKLIMNPLTLDQIHAYGLSQSLAPLVTDSEQMHKLRDRGDYDILWRTAYSAPERYAAVFDRRILVILDEFQNVGSTVYRDEQCERAHDETVPGSWHEHSESKIAPMLVTGSYVGWILNIISKWFEGGRLKIYEISPYLEPEEGLRAVYRYAQYYNEPLTNETAFLINDLCMCDPFFISCVIGSDFEVKDLNTETGVIDAVHYEITNRESEMSKTWGEYIELTLKRVNDIHAKTILLHLSKHPEQEWTPKTLKEHLNLSISEKEIHDRLRILVSADVIAEGPADIDYHGLRDGTLNLILRNRFEKEICTFGAPDLKKEFADEIERLKKDRKSLQEPEI